MECTKLHTYTLIIFRYSNVIYIPDFEKLTSTLNSTHILVNKLSFGYSIMYLAYKILHLHITFTLLYVIRNDFAR